MLLPDRAIEREMLATYCSTAPAGQRVYIAGVDEVGRGSIAGPASVGIALVSLETRDDFPVGLRDSKLLSARAREALVTPVHQWADAIAVGHSTVAEVNDFGIMGALRAAAERALAQLGDVTIAAVLLDGSHDWWSTSGLFSFGLQLPALPVRMEVKGDARCAVIAAASVAAKVERDKLMVAADTRYPGYDFAHNKGYASAKHIAGLESLGPSEFHRTAWNLPGVNTL